MKVCQAADQILMFKRLTCSRRQTYNYDLVFHVEAVGDSPLTVYHK